MSDSQVAETPINSISPENIGPSLSSKRQRRPSVRLGEIGEKPAAISHDPNSKRRFQKIPLDEWKIPEDSKHRSSSSSKSRTLMNFENGINGDADCRESLENDDKNPNLDGDFDSAGTGIRNSTKSGGIGFGDFDLVRLESAAAAREQRRGVSVRVSESEDRDAVESDRVLGVRVSESEDRDAIESDSPMDANTRDWMRGASSERRRSLDDDVRMWLDGLGLGRYAHAFELHEVDEDVLPFLTFDDLKDMGINAVGSRRKMYCAIQKLRKGFT